jgi:hypothetical protein
MPYYLGKRPQGDLLSFYSPTPPRAATHGSRYVSVMGPFRSQVGACYYARYGQFLPRLSDPDRIESLARADPRMAQALVEERLSAEERSIALECAAVDQSEYSPQPSQQGVLPCPIKLNTNA